MFCKVCKSYSGFENDCEDIQCIFIKDKLESLGTDKIYRILKNHLKSLKSNPNRELHELGF
tara:strand:- start:249 stop:431 length:183 start_codon:yes stop_codon:yes gene_type:complete